MSDGIEISESDGERYFHRFRDGSEVGQAAVKEDRPDDPAIQTIEVDEDYRGRGIGCEIVNEICDFYRDDHNRIYALDVFAEEFFLDINFVQCENNKLLERTMVKEL